MTGERWSHRQWPKWLLALAVSLLLMLGAELGLRARSTLSWRGSIDDLYRNPDLPPAGRKATLGRMVRPSPNERLVYELKPGLDVIFRGASVRTNRRGWREGPVERTAPPRTVRILGIGDSTMFGWGVEEEQRYMDLLERRLDSERPEVGWQTVVTAVPGYNLMMQVESLLRSAASLEPDLIVYGWDPNDQCLPHFLLERRGFFEGPSPLVELWRGAATALAEPVFEPPPAASPRSAPRLRSKDRLGARCLGESIPERFRPIAGREAFTVSLRRLARFSAETGAPAVVLAGFGLDFESAMALPVPAALHSVRAAPRAESLDRRELALSRSDPHPSPLGHRLLAEALYEELDEAGFWDRLVSTEETNS